ncbi:aquaporin [Streptomyces sp. B6B3]|uniref:aquaporin n=1 Tax=Streptomyces sp. B6B3 TaxID=3153570 RepID=UPI00325CFDD1
MFTDLFTGSRESLRDWQPGQQPLAGELVGTFALVFFGVGSVVLASEYIGSFGIALAFGFTLLVLMYAIGPVSGCHVNPAVTLGMLLAGRIDSRTAGGYWLAQLVGAFAGAALLFLLAHQVPGLETSESFGSNGWGDRSAVGLNVGGAIIAEIMLTSLLVFVYLSVTYPRPEGAGGGAAVAVAGFDGVPVGLALAAVHLVGNPLTGTSVNPARSIGPAFFAGGQALAQLWLFIVMPLVGAALGVLAHLLLHPRHALPGSAATAPGPVPG